MKPFEWGALSAAISAAVHSGLVEELVRARQPMSTHTLARRTSSEPESIERVLAVLDCAGLVIPVDGSTWRLSGLARDAFAPVGGSVAAFISHTHRYVSDSVRVHTHAGERLAALFSPAARRLAEALPPAAGAVLDVGAGSGVWSLAMAEHDPSARVTALDLEPVLPRFYNRAVRMGLAARIDAIAGDYGHAPLPASCFTRVVLANLLHLESDDSAAALVARAAAALVPGGRLVVAGVWDGGPRTRERRLRWFDAAGLEPGGELDLQTTAAGLSALWSDPAPRLASNSRCF